MRHAQPFEGSRIYYDENENDIVEYFWRVQPDIGLTFFTNTKHGCFEAKYIRENLILLGRL